jgi:hypothetical protein
MRVSSEVKRQLRGAPRVLPYCCQTEISRRMVADLSDATAQALTAGNAQFDLGNVQPAAVLDV